MIDACFRACERLGEPYMQPDSSPLELHVADVLRRARRLPLGAKRNDLHQLGAGLLPLRRHGRDALVEERWAASEGTSREADDRSKSC
jgi:hypothetical protein